MPFSRIMHNLRLHDLYCLLRLNRKVQSMTKRWSGRLSSNERIKQTFFGLPTVREDHVEDEGVNGGLTFQRLNVICFI